MQALDHYINQVKTLPPAPRVLLQLLFLLNETNVDSARVVELVTYDPALAAKILQRCNNAAAGLAQPVADVHAAVTQLGFHEVYRLAAGVIGENTLSPAQRGYGIAAGELWRHAAVTAVAGRIIAREFGADENLVFTAALLHDLGKLVLSASLEKVYAAVDAEIGHLGRSFVEAEKVILGVEHAEVGGRVLARWNFPRNLVRAVWHHHDPLLAHPFEKLAAFVYVADMVAHMLGHGPGHQAHAVHGRGDVMELLAITSRDLEKYVLLTHEALETTDWFIPVMP